MGTLVRIRNALCLEHFAKLVIILTVFNAIWVFICQKQEERKQNAYYVLNSLQDVLYALQHNVLNANFLNFLTNKVLLAFILVK